MSDVDTGTGGRGVVVAGMHRSSTSLVTSIFAAAGFWSAPEMRMREFYNTGWGMSPRLRELRTQELTIPPHLEERAESLISLYRQHSPWVWKNPRATLFLEDWARRLPEAVFVMRVRRPDAVVDSLIRRKSKMSIRGNSPRDRIHRLLRGRSVWRSYNLMALRFVENHPDRAIVVRIPEDLRRLQEMSGTTVIEDELLRQPRARIRIPAKAVLPSRLLYRRLAARADVERLRPVMAAATVASSPAAERDRGAAAVGAVFRVGSAIALAASAVPCVV